MTDNKFEEFKQRVEAQFAREHEWRANHFCPHIEKPCIEGACLAYRAEVQPYQTFFAESDLIKWLYKKLGWDYEPKYSCYARGASCSQDVFGSWGIYE